MSGFRKQVMLASAICLALLASQSAYVSAQTDSVWIGGTGNWNVGGNWSPSGIPNGAFNVFVDDGDVGNSAVTIPNSQTFFVDSLTIDFGDSLQINNNAGKKSMFDKARVAYGDAGEDLLDHLNSNSTFEVDIGGEG